MRRAVSRGSASTSHARSAGVMGLVVFGVLCGANAQDLAFNPGLASDFAGTGGASYSTATFVGAANTVALNFPRRVAVDANGNVYDIEKGGQIARVIASGKGAVPALPSVTNPVAGNVYTVAGDGSTTVCSGKADAEGDGCPATQASLSSPYGIAVDSRGNVYLDDTSDYLIRVVYAGGTIPNLPANPVVGNIYAVAGTGSAGSGGDGGPALSAQIGSSHGVSVDSQGNIYLADSGNQTIRVIYASGTIPGIVKPLAGSIYTIAGTVATACSKAGACGDGGPAISSQIDGPDSTAIDSSGNIYFSDTSDFKVRVIYVAGTLAGISDPIAGDIYTVAGNGISGSSGDGAQATSASLTSGIGQVAIDSVGDIFIPDGTSNTVRKVDATGIISTVFGGASTVCSAHTDAAGDGCPANQATLSSDSGVAVDASGNVYIADYKNNLIRLLTPAASGMTFGGAIGSVIADQVASVSNTGSRALQLSGIALTGPFTQVMSGGMDCNASTSLNAGNSCQIAISATASSVGSFSGSVVVSSNALNATSGQNQISLTSTLTQGATTTALSISPVLANVGQPVTMTAAVNVPAGVSLSPGASVTFYNGTTPLGSGSVSGGVATLTINTLGAGTYSVTASYSGDANFTASVSPAVGLKISTALVPTVTLAASPQAEYGQPVSFIATVAPYSGSQTPTGTVTFLDGANVVGASAVNSSGAANLTLSNLPLGLNLVSASYSGDSTYVANSSSTVGVVISVGAQLTFTPGEISVVAGSYSAGAGFSGDMGPATAAQLKTPLGLAQDRTGNIYIADSANNRIREINAQTGNITTIVGTGSACAAASMPCGDGGPASSALLNDPEAVSVDAADNLYIDDRKDNAIREVSTKTGNISTVAGTLTVQGNSGDGGAATSATLNGPRGLYVDNAGNIYISDSGNALVREVNAFTGVIDTVAGSGTSLGDGGPANAALLVNPRGLFLDSAGNLFIADIGAYRIRKVSSTGGTITTVAGTGVSCSTPPCGDGNAATSANLGGPEGVVVDSVGDLYLTDPNLNAIRKVDTSGMITTVAGEQSTTGAYNGDSGTATSVQLNYPNSVFLDPQGDLYFSEANSSLVREISVNGTSLNFGSVNLGSTAGQLVTVENTGVQPLNLSGLSFASQFSQQPSGSTDCTATLLSPGAACELDVQFSPVNVGTVSGSVYLTDNSTNAIAGQNGISLTGVGVASAGTSTQSIKFSALPNITYGAGPISLTATATSGLAVTYNTVTGPAVISGSTLKITGAGTVTVTAYQFGNNTYAAATPIIQSFQVSPALLTVTAANATRAIQVANPVFTYAISGFVNGDTQDTVSGVPQITTTADVNSPAGTYPITISAGTLAASNYTFAFVSGMLTVSGQSQTITFKPLPSVVYGAGPIMLAAMSTSGLPISYGIALGPATVDGNILSISGAGTVSVIATQAGNGTYAAASPVTQSFSVMPAILTVTANNTVRIVGAANPTFTYSLSGLVGGDTQAALTGAPSFSTTAITSSPAGIYPITINTGTLAATNYSFVFVAGTLTVQPLPPDFTVASNLPSLTLEPGVTGHLSLTLTPVSSYQGSVTLTCSGVPTGSSCAFTPGTVQLDGSGNPAQVDLAITTTYHSTELRKPAIQEKQEVRYAGIFLPAALMLLLLCAPGKRSNSRFRRLAAIPLMMIFAGTLSGCGSISSDQPATVTTVTITATGSVVHATTFQLTVL